jgi:hypothetical protein
MDSVDKVKPQRRRGPGTAEPAQEAVKVEPAVRGPIEPLPDDYAAAKKSPVELADKPSVLSDTAANVAAQVSHDWYPGLRRATDDLGVALQSSGRRLEAGGEALDPFVGFAGEAVARGQAVFAAGQGLRALPEQALESASALLPTVRETEAWGRDFAERVRLEVKAGLQAAEAALKSIEAGVSNLVVGVRDWCLSVVRTADPNHNIEQLGPDDEYTLAVSGSGSLNLAAASASGSIEVSRNAEGKYLVVVEGELGGELHAAIGGKLGAELSAEASGGVAGGASVELTFDTAEGAKEAVRLIRTRLRSGRFDPNDECIDSVGVLSDHTSALELTGSRAVLASIAAQLGAKSLVGVSASAELKSELAIRVELRDDLNQPKIPELVVTQTKSLEAKVSAQSTALSGTGESTVELEQRWKLPKTSIRALLRNPAKALRESMRAVVKVPNDTVKLGLELSGEGFSSGSGVNVEAEYVGEFKGLPRGILDLLRRGNVAGALRVFNQTEVSVKIEPYTTIGVSFSPELMLLGVGLGGEFTASRKDVAEPQYRYQVTGKPSVIAPEVEAKLASYLRS